MPFLYFITESSDIKHGLLIRRYCLSALCGVAWLCKHCVLVHLDWCLYRHLRNHLAFWLNILTLQHICRTALLFDLGYVWWWKNKTDVLIARVTSNCLFCVIFNIFLSVFFSDAIQTLQAEVTRLKERLESCMKTKETLSSVRAAPSAEESYTQQKTSTPCVRLVFIFQV